MMPQLLKHRTLERDKKTKHADIRTRGKAKKAKLSRMSWMSS
jgi:hypothetical protein